jgi:hypothetical protein
MFSSENMDTDQVLIKKEISRTFLRMGLVSLGIGFLAIFIGFLFERKISAIPSFNLLPLLVSVPFIVLVNWLLMRRLIEKIRSHPSGYD